MSLFSLGASVEEGKLADGLAALQIESNRVKQFGFGPAELERAKKWWLASYKRAYNERDKSESGTFAQEYVTHFLTGDPAPRDRVRVPARADALPAITAAGSWRARRRCVFADTSRAILGVSPQRERDWRSDGCTSCTTR